MAVYEQQMTALVNPPVIGKSSFAVYVWYSNMVLKWLEMNESPHKVLELITVTDDGPEITTNESKNGIAMWERYVKVNFSFHL